MKPDNLQLWPDSLLVRDMQSNDRSAFEKIYNRYWSKLYLSAYHILRNREASEDIIQEIFVSLWLKREHSAVDNLNNYLFTAVRFQVFKAIRDGKIRTDLLHDTELLVSANNAENAFAEKEIAQRLDESIELLPQKCKEIFILSRKEHLSVKEIAARLNISPKTVENQITIALRRLRTDMGEFLFWAILLLAGIWGK
ncbi:RNA polymerase sigma-70 factor (ECF subfamily) [Pedobacter sp. AK013]|uniref:RNA polymerase sigma-70 factor n=1 Tax=Pedobacter sp. AK013 TaxID=2723071 RepID=UPI00161A7C64|nr:RNA polymerase sigma-70 factor [Pedobacter sp. AK013]MBB6237459.1 RNA polymerase sigma-70 factor (ECF subfamily) [Pedobacter sp. AK013]